jgi:phosphonate transport system substrate-binding protein
MCCLILCIYIQSGYAAGWKPKLIIGIVPEADLAKQMEVYVPLCRYLGIKLDYQVEVKPLRNHGLIFEELKNNQIDAGFFGSFIYAMTHERIGLVPVARPVKTDGDSMLRGVTFVRKDSNIHSPKDMKGKVIALVDPATTTGYLAQKLYFKKYGLDIDKDVKIIWATNHDRAVMMVYEKKADMGGSNDHAFEKAISAYPALKEGLTIVDTSPEVPDSTFAVDISMDVQLRTRLTSVLLEMGSDPAAQDILKKIGAKRFVKTAHEEYGGLYKMAKEAAINLKTYPYRREDHQAGTK